MLNREGRRFLDEGYDHHSMTYALYGGLVLAEPGGVAFQIFDSKVLHLLENLDQLPAAKELIDAVTI